ncbi:unknown [Bacteroides sp. CAG:1060]|nr:unknown [Bacteroides sp. CAG:1060]
MFLIIFNFLFLRLLTPLLYNFLYLYIHLIRSLLDFEILAELFGNSRHIALINFGIRIGIKLDTDLLKEVHKVIKPDIELSNYFIQSYFCHSVLIFEFLFQYLKDIRHGLVFKVGTLGDVGLRLLEH